MVGTPTERRLTGGEPPTNKKLASGFVLSRVTFVCREQHSSVATWIRLSSQDNNWANGFSQNRTTRIPTHSGPRHLLDSAFWPSPEGLALSDEGLEDQAFATIIDEQSSCPRANPVRRYRKPSLFVVFVILTLSTNYRLVVSTDRCSQSC